MQPDGRQILMLAPGMMDYGEHRHSGNHQFGMLRAAAYLQAEHGCNITWVEGGLLPSIDPFFPRLKDRVRGERVRFKSCGRGAEGVGKWQMYYGRGLPEIRHEMAMAPRPDEVWIGSGLTYHWETTAELVHITRQMFPSTRIRVGGIYPSLAPDHARSTCSGAEIHTGEIPEASEYWPDYSVLPYSVPFRTVKWNTGCTIAKACSFCSVKALEPRFRVNGSPASLTQYIEDEMHKGVRAVMLWASQLLQPPAVFAELMDRIALLRVKYGVDLQLYASEGIQPSLFTPEMARRMVRAGFKTINIPMESIDPDTLKAFNKPSSLTDYHRSVEIAKEAGLSSIGAFIMIGTPQQKLDELVHAIVDCWYRRVRATLMKYTIIPGSQDWDDHPEVHEGYGLEDLNPSLWRGARDDLTVIDLEEVVAIARMGYELWARLPQEDIPFPTPQARTRSRVDDCFLKWCSRYGLVKNHHYLPLDQASPHEPAWGRHTPEHEDLLRYSVGTDIAVSMAV